MCMKGAKGSNKLSKWKCIYVRANNSCTANYLDQKEKLINKPQRLRRRNIFDLYSQLKNQNEQQNGAPELKNENNNQLAASSKSIDNLPDQTQNILTNQNFESSINSDQIDILDNYQSNSNQLDYLHIDDILVSNEVFNGIYLQEVTKEEPSQPVILDSMPNTNIPSDNNNLFEDDNSQIFDFGDDYFFTFDQNLNC